MAREINRLTSKTVDALQEPGLHADGAGLYLRIDQTLNRRWVFVFFWRGRRREMGLGAAAGDNLRKARLAAADARRLLSEGVDPIDARKRELLAASPRTFGEVALELIEQLKGGWKSEVTPAQWESSLKMHAPKIWLRPVADVDTVDVLDALKKIWASHHETARRVRMRIERTLDYARVKGFRDGENPARWRGHMQLMLPSVSHVVENHASMSYEDLPAFIVSLRKREATAARALEFTILTVARTTVTVEATWGEIVGDVWIIPKERMKTPKDHRVPLTPRMVEILDEMRPLRTAGDYIFPGDQRIEPLSDMAMLMLLRRMKVDVTVHGFRATFKDWAEDCTDHSNVIIETALAHSVGGAVERAYRRRDALEKRRALMADWEAFCTTPPSAKVIPFARA